MVLASSHDTFGPRKIPGLLDLVENLETLLSLFVGRTLETTVDDLDGISEETLIDSIVLLQDGLNVLGPEPEGGLPGISRLGYEFRIIKILGFTSIKIFRGSLVVVIVGELDEATTVVFAI